MRKTIIPRYVLNTMKLPNSRAFKVKKRGELLAVIHAVDRLRIGCAYMPGQQAAWMAI